MKVLVLHNEPGEDAAVDERDVLAQRDAVAGALEGLGHEVATLGCTLDLAVLRRRLDAGRPDLVFNLVESLGGTDRLMPLATLLLESLGIPFTGAGTEAILATSNKPHAKARLRGAGLPTAAWLSPDGDEGASGPRGHEPGDFATAADPRWIVKPIWEHASVGMADDAVLATRDCAALVERIRERERQTRRPHFAERFVEGREFNLSLLAGELLPAAEIDFSAYPEGKPRIVGHTAKWDSESFEYRETPRRFEFSAADRPLLARLADVARRCVDLFGLRAHARVDFRVDRTGEPFVLEVNANPCLSRDAGFAAAVERAGIEYDEAIRRIVATATGEP